MRGVSGSGKSTVARQLAAGEVGAIIVSADSYFETPEGYKWESGKLSEAHGHCFRLFMAAVNAGAELVVVDNTNRSSLEIAPYMMAAQAFGYEAAIVEVHCDPQEAAARNVHNVPVESVEKMARRMEGEHLPPWWNVVRVETGVEGSDGGNKTESKDSDPDVVPRPR